jgi:hypothetical protein
MAELFQATLATIVVVSVNFLLVVVPPSEAGEALSVLGEALGVLEEAGDALLDRLLLLHLVRVGVAF